MIRCREKPAHVCGRGPLIEVELPRRCRAGTAGNDPKPTSDALRRSRHEANGAFPFGSGARLCAHRDPGGQSARDLILARRSFHGGQDAARPAHRALRFCRHQPRGCGRHLWCRNKAGVADAEVTAAPAFHKVRCRIGLPDFFGCKPIRAESGDRFASQNRFETKSSCATEEQPFMATRNARSRLTLD